MDKKTTLLIDNDIHIMLAYMLSAWSYMLMCILIMAKDLGLVVSVGLSLASLLAFYKKNAKKAETDKRKVSKQFKLMFLLTFYCGHAAWITYAVDKLASNYAAGIYTL